MGKIPQLAVWVPWSSRSWLCQAGLYRFAVSCAPTVSSIELLVGFLSAWHSGSLRRESGTLPTKTHPCFRSPILGNSSIRAFWWETPPVIPLWRAWIRDMSDRDISWRWPTLQSKEPSLMPSPGPKINVWNKSCWSAHCALMLWHFTFSSHYYANLCSFFLLSHISYCRTIKHYIFSMPWPNLHYNTTLISFINIWCQYITELFKTAGSVFQL